MENFKDRSSQNINRRKLTIISQTPNEMVVDIERAEGTVIEQGTAINAATFNSITNEINEKKGTKVQVKDASNNYIAQETVNFNSDPQTQLTNEISNRQSADSGLQTQINQRILSSNILAGKGISVSTSGNNVTINNSQGLLGSVVSGNALSATADYCCCMIYGNGDMVYYGRKNWDAQQTTIAVGPVSLNNNTYTPTSTCYPVSMVTYHPRNFVSREWILYANPTYSSNSWHVIAATNSGASDNATWDYIIKCKYQ